MIIRISLDIFVCIVSVLLLLWKVPRLSASTYLPIFRYTLNLDPVCLTESWCNIEKIKMGWCKGSGIALMLEGGAAYFFSAELLCNRTVFQGDWKNSSRWNLKLKVSKSDLVGGGCCADGFSKNECMLFLLHTYDSSFWGFKVPQKHLVTRNF